MPDSVIPFPAQANAVRPGLARPSGLPIFCTEPLTAAERDGLLVLINQHETQANLLKLALLAGTVADALGAMRVGVSLGQVEEALSLRLGSNR
jgi:hypothetical protein